MGPSHSSLPELPLPTPHISPVQSLALPEPEHGVPSSCFTQAAAVSFHLGTSAPPVHLVKGSSLRDGEVTLPHVKHHSRPFIRNKSFTLTLHLRPLTDTFYR